MSAIEKYRKDYKPYPFTIEKIHLDFDFQDSKCIVKSRLEISRKDSVSVTEPLILDGEDLDLKSIALDGVVLTPSSYKVSDTQLLISDVPKSFVLEITNLIFPAKNTSLSGLYQSNKKYCTQCEAEGFRRITFYPDRPDVLSRYQVTITADKDKYPYLLSNGELTSSSNLSETRHQAIWSDPHPKPSYLFALVAGDFDLLEDTYTTRSDNEVELQIYVDKGKLDQCHFAMESLKQSMHWDEKTYGLEYDLNRYMVVAVGDFNMGAMENKGLNIFNTAYVLANDKTATDADFTGVEAVIGHEYFHNWTGNRVTCRDWFQLSLKEGLTVFREQQFSGDMNSHSIQRIDDVKRLVTYQFPEDAGPMAHPIRPDSYIEMNNFYTHTVYIKGAEVIRMLETILGKATFNRGVRHYLEKHDGQAVTCEDFVVAMEEVSGQDLSNFRLWYSQSGTPEVSVDGVWLEEKSQFVLVFEQTCPPTPGQSSKQPFHIPIKLGLMDEHGSPLKLQVASSETDVKYDLNTPANEITIHLQKSHHRICFDAMTKQPVPSLLRGFTAPVKLDYDYSVDERLALIANDKDPFVKWQANQVLFKFCLNQILTTESPQSNIERLVDAVIQSRLAIIADKRIDPAFKALQIELPSLVEVMEWFNPIPINQLIELWPQIKHQIGKRLIQELSQLIVECESEMKQHVNDRKIAAQWRRLLVAAISVAAAAGDTEILNRAKRLYHDEQSMTIKQGMLSIVHHHYTEQSRELIDDFYSRWQEEELVLDKWFSIQATLADDSVFEAMEDLLQHADFSLTNPNKVRALLFRFAQSNPTQFHHHSGRGYQLISSYVRKLDSRNPQVAARLCGSFNSWRQLDCDNRRSLIKESLNNILSQENLSPDVFEIANKALA